MPKHLSHLSFLPGAYRYRDMGVSEGLSGLDGSAVGQEQEGMVELNDIRWEGWETGASATVVSKFGPTGKLVIITVLRV